MAGVNSFFYNVDTEFVRAAQGRDRTNVICMAADYVEKVSRGSFILYALHHAPGDSQFWLEHKCGKRVDLPNQRTLLATLEPARFDCPHCLAEEAGVNRIWAW